MTSFFRFVTKWTIYRLGIISLAHAPVHATNFPVVKVHVDESSSARIWQHKLCATFSANININNCLPIKVYYSICTLRHIRIKIIHGSQNVFWVLTWVGRVNLSKILIYRQPMLKHKTHSRFHDLFLNYHFIKFWFKCRKFCHFEKNYISNNCNHIMINGREFDIFWKMESSRSSFLFFR